MNAPPPTVVFFCTPEVGHFQALRAVVARVVARGISAYVFTHARFQHQVELEGGTFVDLFGKYPIDEADSQSKPVPCRFVSFAGHYAEQVIEEVRDLDPALIIYETFSVIGMVVAKALDLPYVNVCVSHNPNPARLLVKLQNDPRVAVSTECFHAVEKLRRRFGIGDASPFSYVSALSPWLNVYCEPPQFLSAEDRETLQPLEYFGCLPDPISMPGNVTSPGTYFDAKLPDDLRVYVCFGTVVWRYFAREAAAALLAISRACSEIQQIQAVISLGGVEVAADIVESLQQQNVRVVSYINQSMILAQANLFVTHHGLNSTHEAIFNRVAMISYPFFWDQPALAVRCQKLGVAIPLTENPLAPPTINNVKAAFSTFLRNKHLFRANLDRAWAWEKKTMDERELIVQRIIDLIRSKRVSLAEAA